MFYYSAKLLSAPTCCFHAVFLRVAALISVAVEADAVVLTGVDGKRASLPVLIRINHRFYGWATILEVVCR